MARSGDATTIANTQTTPINAVWIIRLDFQNDPVYINTSLSDLTFAGGSGYDPALVGFTFKGVGLIGTIDAIADGVDGSQTITLTLPGVDTGQDYLHQILVNGDLWQGYYGYLWLATFDANGALSGKPVRVKTSRMDKLVIDIDGDGNKGELALSLESQQSYSGDALNTLYADQKTQIDSTDTSQDYIASLATKVPGYGVNNQQSGRGTGGGGHTIPVQTHNA